MRIISKFSSLALFIGVAIASVGAQASSIDVQVIGTITPGACVATLAGGGTVDYGKIGATEVNQADFTVLAEKTLPFSINCQAATKVGLKAVDNRASSVVPGAVALSSATKFGDGYAFGLGEVSGAHIGSYVLRLPQKTATADGKIVFSTLSANNGITWVAPGPAGGIQSGNDTLTTWSLIDGGSPAAFKVLSGSLVVQAILNKGSALPLTEEVTLDGSATLELVYL